MEEGPRHPQALSAPGENGSPREPRARRSGGSSTACPGDRGPWRRRSPAPPTGAREAAGASAPSPPVPLAARVPHLSDPGPRDLVRVPLAEAPSPLHSRRPAFVPGGDQPAVRSLRGRPRLRGARAWWARGPAAPAARSPQPPHPGATRGAWRERGRCSLAEGGSARGSPGRPSSTARPAGFPAPARGGAASGLDYKIFFFGLKNSFAEIRFTNQRSSRFKVSNSVFF